MLGKTQQIHLKARLPFCSTHDTTTTKTGTPPCVNITNLGHTFRAQRAYLDTLVDDVYTAKKKQSSFSDGCTSAKECGYTLARPAQVDHTKKHVHVSYIKTTNDSANHKKCCLATNDDPQDCSSEYSPLDKDGKCVKYVKQFCCGTPHACQRQKFLGDADQSKYPKDFFCAYWYMSNINSYIPSLSAAGGANSNHDDCSGKGVDKQNCRQKKKTAAFTIISDYCAKYPETGECSCYNAADLCECETSGQKCYMFGDVRKNYGRRLELYMQEKDNNGNNKFQPLEPGSSLFKQQPVHCWSRACQVANHCAFFPENSFERKCPSICAQFGANTTINLKNVQGYNELAIDSWLLRCTAKGAPSGADKVPQALQFSTGHIQDAIAPQTWVNELRATFQLVNRSYDQSDKKQGTRRFCISSTAPKIAYVLPRRGCLPSKSSTDMKLYVNTAGLDHGQYFVDITVQDVCDGSTHFSLLYNMFVYRDPRHKIPPHATQH